MKLFTNLLVVVILTLNTITVKAQTYNYPIEKQQGFSLSEKTRDGMHVNYELEHFSLSQLNYRGEEMSEIAIKGIVLPNTEGYPNLPTESRMLAIPQGATATLNVLRADQQVIKNVNIAPALRIQAENEEPEMEYRKDQKVYSRNAFYPEHPFEVSKTYMRGVNAVIVSITPFQYNPVTKDLIVYTNIELSLSYEGGTRHFGDDRLRSPYWDPILAAELMNYDQLPVIDYEARMQQWLRDEAEGAEYLIITPNNDEWAPYAEQLREYRTRQGILTKVYRLDEMPATTTEAMRQWFHNAYYNWDIPPVAVCLLGDHNTDMTRGIPAIVTPHTYSDHCITDNFYADAEGNDNLPDMVFSRLVAQNASELPVFVGKQIEYEYTNPNTDPSFYTSPITALGWQTERWFQICSEVVGGYFRLHDYTPTRINCIYQGIPDEIWSDNQNTSLVTDYFGPNGVGYLPESPSELGDWNNGSPEQVVHAVNTGSFWLQHRDHGLVTGWGEPSVSNEHIEQMNNVGKLPFVMSINCQTGQFDYTDGNCFCEAWMRRTYNGENAGAVGVLCPTEVSYSFVNDVFVWGVYDLFDSDFLPDYGSHESVAPKKGNWMPAFGNVAGKYFLAQSSWPYNPDDKDITYTMFTAHCDAFLNIFTQVPQTIAVSHQEVQYAGEETIQINAPRGTTIALTKGEGDDLEVMAVAAARGTIQDITIPAQTPPTVLRLTVTGHNYLRYEADIEVIPSEGPYLIVNDFTLANEATQLNFGDEAGFDIVLKNVGNALAPAGIATLTTESEYVTITNGTIDFDAIDSNATSNFSNAFSFTISDALPNKTPISFTVSIASGDAVYESHINVKAYAPVFKIGNMSILEIEGNGNGRLDPGEIAELKFDIVNKGNAASRETDATLVVDNEFIHILNSEANAISSINVNDTVFTQYQVYVGGAPIDSPAGFTLDVVSGAYTESKDFTTRIGYGTEDFETGTIDAMLWTNNSTAPWTISNESPYEGNYCLKSGKISHNEETETSITYTVTDADTISFYYKVSSEFNYDKFFFYVDGVEINNWSGEINWTLFRYPVTIGQHTFTWKYSKDVSVSNNSDCVWIDLVSLPRDTRLITSAGIDLNICKDDAAHLLGFAINQQSILWSTLGDGTFDDPNIGETTYNPGPNDIENGSATLTITATDNQSATATDTTTVTIHRAATIEDAGLNTIHCAISEPQAVAVNVNGEYTTFAWTTSGDGSFEDPSVPSTTYTPGPEDLENGVSLTAAAISDYCGTTTFVYPFEFSPKPELTVANDAIEVCEGESVDIELNFTGIAPFTVEAEGIESFTSATGSYTLTLSPTEFTEIRLNKIIDDNGCETMLDQTIMVEVKTRPELTLGDMPSSICQGETIAIAAAVAGDYDSFVWTTSGDGTFDDATATETVYTPGPQDNENKVTLTATANSALCGNLALEHTFSINRMPVMNMPLPNCAIMICQGQDYTLDYADFSGYVDGQMTMEVNGEPVTLTEGQPLVLHTAELAAGNHTFEFHHLNNGLCETDPNISFDIQVTETPNLTVAGTAFKVCQGESIAFELNASGGDPLNPNYTITGEGLEPIVFTGASYTMEMTPSESTEIHLTQISVENIGCGDSCSNALDITLKVEVTPVSDLPVISGDTLLDVRVTPVSTYTIANDVEVSFALEPSEAGTIAVANDDKTVAVTWSKSYKGKAVLTATPLSECNNGGGSMTINVRNTFSIDELTANTKIFPNPTSGQVSIECEGMTHISVYSTLGQMVYDEEVDADRLSIDLSQSPAGSYLVRIVTHQGTVVKKLYVK